MKLILCIILFFPIQILSLCPNNGVEFQNQCFYFFGNAAGFHDAEVACQEMNGHLTSIHDAFTDGFLAKESKKVLKSTDFWIGLSTLNTSGTWSWTDNTPFNFADWESSEPQSISESCASFTIQNGYWKSDDCSLTKAYVCEYTTPSSNPPYMNCTEGWVYFELTHSCYGHDGYDYQFGNWSWGEQYCESIGGHLPSLHSYDETRFLSTLTTFNGGTNLWTGLISFDNESSWVWSDNSPVDYLPWASDFPISKFSSCAYLSANKIFNNISCTDDGSLVVCKKPANDTDLPQPTVTPSYPAYMNCTEGWVYFEPTQSCYGHDGYMNRYGNWSSGEKYCESVGGHLLSLHSYDEARFISTGAQFSGGNLWTGLSFNDDSWKWSDDSPVDYLPWAKRYPKLNVSRCAYLYENAMYDSSCSDARYICKKLASV